MADHLLKLNKLPVSGAYPEINVNEQKILSKAKAGEQASDVKEESPVEPVDSTPDLLE